MLKRKIRAYLAHPIRGAKGADATQEDMEINNQKAIEFAKRLDIYFGSNLEIYVPGEHDEFIMLAYLKGILTEKQILEIDCEILSKRDIVIVAYWSGQLSRGMQTEVMKATELGIPIFVLSGLDIVSLEKLRITLETL